MPAPGSSVGTPTSNGQLAGNPQLSGQLPVGTLRQHPTAARVTVGPCPRNGLSSAPWQARRRPEPVVAATVRLAEAVTVLAGCQLPESGDVPKVHIDHVADLRPTPLGQELQGSHWLSEERATWPART